jgi:hypothetical protein
VSARIECAARSSPRVHRGRRHGTGGVKQRMLNFVYPCGTSDQPNRQLGKISQLFDCTCLLPSRVVLSGSSGCDTKYSRPAVAAQHHAGATPSNTPSGFCQVTNARSRRPGLLYTGQSIGCIRQEGHPQDSIATALLAAMQPISPPSSPAEANLRVSTSQACNCV